MIPAEVFEQGDEIALSWERGDEGVKITAVLGEASIQVEASYGAVAAIPWMVAALPNILESAWAEIEANQEPQEGM